jgi:YHS domain-containing protein
MATPHGQHRENEHSENHGGDLYNQHRPASKHNNHRSHQHHQHSSPTATLTADKMAKDPICGMLVEKATALKTERAGRAYYFCSQNCLNTFLDPEREIKSMRTRVTVAMAGVLMLAICGLLRSLD